jgi:hypothetical protein
MMTRIIPLTQGKETIVDDDDFDELSKYKWYFNLGYAVRMSARPNRMVLLMHREILKTPLGMDTDHINGNKLDNQRANLRICTRSENMMNTPKYPNKTSPYKGVYWFAQTNKWGSIISVNKKKLHLGFFVNPIDAARAYDIAALAYHGEFARINFPELAKG